mmetsp:Transcript_31744/g.82943  ORF Transcript_31744/g.82943 Transcript_31744/m.82943 type:complete len:229 (-) Transcript_31744:937-1623(-)
MSFHCCACTHSTNQNQLRNPAHSAFTASSPCLSVILRCVRRTYSANRCMCVRSRQCHRSPVPSACIARTPRGDSAGAALGFPEHYLLKRLPKNCWTFSSSLTTSLSMPTTSFTISFSTATTSFTSSFSIATTSFTTSWPTVPAIISTSVSSRLTSFVTSLNKFCSVDCTPVATLDSTNTRSFLISSIFVSAARHELSVSLKSLKDNPTFCSASSTSLEYFFGKAGSRV